MMTVICGALIALTIGTSSAGAARKNAASETPLTEAGKKLLERYTGMLTELQKEIYRAVPTVAVLGARGMLGSVIKKKRLNALAPSI